MSVLVKGVDMPKDCVYCKWHTRWGCGITGIRTNTAQGCPLIEVPTPHGRLIDADAVCYQLEKQATIDGQPRAIRRARRIVADAPAIIEAEEGTDHE